MAEAVAVGVRVRPFNDREKALKAELCIGMDGPTTTLTVKGKESVFTFDESFWSHDGFRDVDGLMVPLPGSKYADQQAVFNSFGKRVLNNAWDGFHCCLFAYGQTGAGKSYSMVGYGKNKGIIPISCEQIFRRVEDNQAPNRRYEITASMIEIYNETVQDLQILPQDRPKGGLQIHESKMLGVYVEGVRKTPVETYAAIERVIDTAEEHRTVGNTLMNATSSRGHSVLTIEFKQVEISEGKEGVKLSMINLVDLAGSEKATQTGAEGGRLKEGCMINQSLSALGNVIEKLAKKSMEKKKKEVIIPYRDSKLTRLLQNALGGSSKTIMICALSPASSNAEETLSTLRYADRAKRIKNVATVNEDPQGRLLREMREENEQLANMLKTLSGGGAVDTEAMQARMEELLRAEKAHKEMQRSFEDRVKESKEVERAMHERERKKGWSHIMVRRQPQIVNLNEDRHLCGKLIYCFEEGVDTRIGNPNAEDEDDEAGSQSSSSSGASLGRSASSGASGSGSSEGCVPPDVVLSGEDIEFRQATVTNWGGVCYLHSEGRAAGATWINGRSVEELLDKQQPTQGGEVPRGVRLEHMDRVAFGVGGHMIFVFIDPDRGTAEQVLLSESVTYTVAREELRRRFAKRFRGLGIVFTEPEVLEGEAGGGSGSPVGLRHLPSPDGDGPCTCCRRELGERERELCALRAELEAARSELAALQPRQLPPSLVSAKARETFESALGALDLLEMSLLSTAKGHRRGDPGVDSLYSF